MATSISTGTLLRQRYLIKQILGQGGFGRTYLAIDQERFDEPCVLKEFTVPYQDDALIDKAKTLFHREASTLHQVQHPQIPRFWAAFEHEQRLFLVQDFVKGQTYRALLQGRKQRGQAFSEAEILYLLNHLLPVLSYLHTLDIIHRDISPDNIILQISSDSYEIGGAEISNARLPVLIDFGAVKEAASHWPIVSTITRVGKVGYAPPEQLQTGNVSPHSDIYALGASCLVLLTGREPQSLLDSQTLAWQWQPYAQMSDGLATVLQKMLALHPGDRYQSAQDVWADLQPLIEGGVKPTLLSPMMPPSVEQDIAPAARDSSDSQVITTIKTKLFMGSNHHGFNHHNSGFSDTPQTMIKPATSQKLAKKRERPPGVAQPSGSYIAIAASLLITTGIGAHLFKVTSPLGSSTQAIKVEPGKDDLRSAGLVSNGQPKKIEFEPGEISSVQQGNLQDKNMQPYYIEAAQGQIMTVTLGGAGVEMNLLRANGQAIDSSAYRSHSWTGQLPANEEYIIEVNGSGAYSMDVAITPISSSPYSDTQLVKFARGKTSTAVTGESRANRIRRYLVPAKTRQVMAVRVLKGDISLSAIAPNGRRIGGSSTNSRDWQGRLPMEGDYVIEVSSPKTENFALSFEVN
ncbi:serine/threonine-protein kinase [Myxacorys almedinensis]|uniref:non-specific serine/threonine protein kinase n=1 Tax=Myxacorys almedinensis A TaxID=2690445 RepID=A0A8J7Z0R3_9CYAN|nr:serine/threonine-protein kinase [Myxacorys almedinensis]NDJ17589.1 protein kinase [Myxacorys almedinensis A]